MFTDVFQVLRLILGTLWVLNKYLFIIECWTGHIYLFIVLWPSNHSFKKILFFPSEENNTEKRGFLLNLLHFMFHNNILFLILFSLKTDCELKCLKAYGIKFSIWSVRQNWTQEQHNPWKTSTLSTIPKAGSSHSSLLTVITQNLEPHHLIFHVKAEIWNFTYMLLVFTVAN